MVLISKKDRERIDKLSKSEIGEYLMTRKPKTNIYGYAVQRFVKLR